MEGWIQTTTFDNASIHYMEITLYSSKDARYKKLFMFPLDIMLFLSLLRITHSKLAAYLRLLLSNIGCSDNKARLSFFQLSKMLDSSNMFKQNDFMSKENDFVFKQFVWLILQICCYVHCLTLPGSFRR
jgi:hypothetical protein